MEDSILNWILKIVIHMSALISVLKTKKKILHTMLECIYCAVISALPVFVLSYFVVAVNGNENINIGAVIGWVSYLVCGPLVYFVISNSGNEKKIEDYLLLGALYIDEYINNKPQIKKHKFVLVTELINFILLFILLLWGIISLLRTLNILSFDTIMIGFVLNLFLAYILFVYGKCDEETRKRRKAILGVFISLVWLIVVCVRINQYWQDMPQVGLEDMLILFFSAVFTIPTIYGWVKSIPKKLVEPHAERVHARRDEIIEKYTIAKKESKRLGIQVIDDLKATIKIIIHKWRNGEKIKIIKLIFAVIAAVIFMILMLWLGNNLAMLADKSIEWVKLCYNNLEYGVQKTINEIFFLLFLIGIMLGALFKAPSNYLSKGNWLEKAKYIVGLIFFELIIGFVAVRIMFFNKR